MNLRNARLGVVASLAMASAAQAGESAPLFEPHVLGILTKHCGDCHIGDDAESSLAISSRDQLLTGGDSGPAIFPGSAERSLLIERIVAGEMPPEGPPLSDEELSALRNWIDAGAHVAGEGPSAQPNKQVSAVSEAEVLTRVFFTHCISCHGKWKQEGGLDLRTTESMKRGGKSGPAIIPGDGAASLVYKKILADQMPPRTSVLGESNYVRRVAVDDVARLKEWIDAGAPVDSAPPAASPAPSPGSEPEKPTFWSFVPVKSPPLPDLVGDDSPNPIDRFVKHRLGSAHLKLSPPASKLTLMRRAYFDLIGLPPSPEEVRTYLADDRPDAYERLVDRLLESPSYGERWAQHWLDAAGYADSHGKIDRDQFRPFMWRYRDYVIRSLNADKPYDQFLAEQLAGDEIVEQAGETLTASQQIERLIATGFLLTATDATDEAAFNFVPQRMGVVAEQIDILSTAVMGLTLECSRCHNHKFDPISQSDYYRFSAIFQSALDPYDWRIVSQVYHPARIPLDKAYQRYIYHPADAQPEELARFNNPLRARVAELEARLVAAESEARKRLVSNGEAAVDKLTVDDLAAREPEFKRTLDSLRGEIAAANGQIISPGVILGVRDLGGDPTPAYLLRRGDPLAPGMQVRPGVPRWLEPIVGPYAPEKPSAASQSSGNRLALAQWLTGPEHPLTSRVIVNRIWQHHFGRGIVSTPGNFGAKGARPTDPELLDWLAYNFMTSGWSLKSLHRLIMTSDVYRQTSQPNDAQFDADPGNAYWSRFPYQRLDGESIRDSLLAVSGQLDGQMFGPPTMVSRLAEGEVVANASPGSQRRSIYMAKMRLRPLTLIEQFDGPEMTPNCLERTQSTVATQALQLYNSNFVRQSAASLAAIIAREAETPREQQVEEVYLRVFTRLPDDDERQLALDYLGKLEHEWARQLPPEQAADACSRARETFCHALLNSPEFLYVD